MRSVAALAAALLLLPGAASAMLNCDTGTIRKIVLAPDKGRLQARGTLSPADPLNPGVTGLALSLVIDPETDPSGRLLDVDLDASQLATKRGGWRYKDRTGALDGLTLLKLKRRRDGSLKVTLRGKKAAPFEVPEEASGARLVVTAGSACVRTCPGVCAPGKKNKVKCTKSVDSALCGLQSGCEPFGALDGSGSRNCLLPYPSNFFTTTDDTTATGRRIDYRLDTMPANVDGVPVDPTPYNKLDGFSPGPIIMAHFPTGVGLAASSVASSLDFAASLDEASPTILIEADTNGCVRVEHFGENDVSENNDGMPVSPPGQLFMIRPGRRLKSGTRYIVGLRGLIGQDGIPLAPPPAFRTIRDGTESGSASVERRRRGTERIIEKLETDCGVDRNELVLAWDFTTASDESIGRYLLHMRDETFQQFPGDAVPVFSVDSFDPDPDHPSEVCRLVKGNFSAPLWTTFNGPGSVLNLDPDTDLPVQNGVADDIPFTAMIPCSLINPTPRAGRPIFYGHGLLGSGEGEVTAGNLRTLANTHDFVIAATDWQGFSEVDLPAVLGFITEMSGFPQLSERLHQGILNQLLLARLLRSPAGFASHPAFQVSGTPLIDTSEVYYYGNSQGGIEGGVVMALSQEATRGVLGVAAANYSTLLHRSVDFDPFFILLRDSYPDPVVRGLLLGLIQQLWDRSEPNGWYHRTLPGLDAGTPPHKLLVLMARSDDEVSNLATEIMVRSMGMPQMAPVNFSYFGIGELTTPFDGSAFVESDFGLPDPPITNTPPADNDVHGQMRALPEIQAMIDRFLRPDGVVENFCTSGATNACDPD